MFVSRPCRAACELDGHDVIPRDDIGVHKLLGIVAIADANAVWDEGEGTGRGAVVRTEALFCAALRDHRVHITKMEHEVHGSCFNVGTQVFNKTRRRERSMRHAYLLSVASATGVFRQLNVLQ